MIKSHSNWLWQTLKSESNIFQDWFCMVYEIGALWHGYKPILANRKSSWAKSDNDATSLMPIATLHISVALVVVCDLADRLQCARRCCTCFFFVGCCVKWCSTHRLNCHQSRHDLLDTKHEKYGWNKKHTIALAMQHTPTFPLFFSNFVHVWHFWTLQATLLLTMIIDVCLALDSHCILVFRISTRNRSIRTPQFPHFMISLMC